MMMMMIIIIIRNSLYIITSDQPMYTCQNMDVWANMFIVDDRDQRIEARAIN